MQLLASGATGSLRESIEPRHLVICDQVIDKTYKRENTFFDDGLVAAAGLGAIAILIPYYLALYFFRKRINRKFTFSLKA